MKRLPLALVPSRGSDVVLACVIALVLLLCAHDAHAQSSDRQRYDIPVLALDSALARFSEISGIDVLLREPAADQSMSNPVQGTFSPAEALHLLWKAAGWSRVSPAAGRSSSFQQTRPAPDREHPGQKQAGMQVTLGSVST